MRDTITDDTPVGALTVGQLISVLKGSTPTVDKRSDWLDQHTANIGPKRFAKLHRRRQALGLPGVAKAGRRFLMTPEALAEELERVEPTAAAGLDAELAELRAGVGK